MTARGAGIHRIGRKLDNAADAFTIYFFTPPYLLKFFTEKLEVQRKGKVAGARGAIEISSVFRVTFFIQAGIGCLDFSTLSTKSNMRNIIYHIL